MVKCCDCQATYIGETNRNLYVRLTEQKRATRNGDNNNHTAEHHLKTNHRIDCDSAVCVAYSTEYYQLKGLRHEDFATLGFFFLLKSLLSAFTQTQNTPVKLEEKYQMNFIRES